MTVQLKGKSVLVLGLGLSGCSAAHYLLSQGNDVFAYDDHWDVIQSRPEIQELKSLGLKICHSKSLPEVEVGIVSPGVPRTHPLYVEALKQNLSIMGEAELALSLLSKNYRCVGVTGTNGKTTVTFLIEHILNTCGIPAKALGNSGIPLTSFLMVQDSYPPETVIVAELSSFQLETLCSPILDAAVLLNITPDHLDRYSSFLEYAQTKMQIFKCVKPKGKCYIQAQCYQDFAKISKKSSLLTYEPFSLWLLEDLREFFQRFYPIAPRPYLGDMGFGASEVNSSENLLNLLEESTAGMAPYGRHSTCFLHSDGHSLFSSGFSQVLPDIPLLKYGHDLENVLAAYAIALEFTHPQAILESLSSYQKPLHRLEFVANIGGVNFMNDSKATNLDAVIRAVESISTPIVLIAGGVDKGESYKAWLKPFEGKVRAICTIGQAARKMAHELNQLPIHHFPELREAVIFAAGLANPNETVLLSPGCSSYDMFTDYVQRGMLFKEIVHSLVIKDAS